MELTPDKTHRKGIDITQNGQELIGFGIGLAISLWKSQIAAVELRMAR